MATQGLEEGFLATQGGTYLHTTTQRGWGADVGSQVDMHTCTDACTNSNQGVGPEKG